MDIPVDVDVICTDGPGGRSTTIILNPFSTEITPIVVKEGKEEFLDPVKLISDSTPIKIHSRCLVEDLRKLERFVRMQF